jgi:hypothetical protein
MTCSPLNGSQAQKAILMGLAAFTAAGITGCTQPARLAGPASRWHPARHPAGRRERCAVLTLGP